MTTNSLVAEFDPRSRKLFNISDCIAPACRNILMGIFLGISPINEIDPSDKNVLYFSFTASTTDILTEATRLEEEKPWGLFWLNVFASLFGPTIRHNVPDFITILTHWTFPALFVYLLRS